MEGRLNNFSANLATVLQVFASLFGFVAQAIVPVSDDISQPPFVSVKGIVNIIGCVAALLLIYGLDALGNQFPRRIKLIAAASTILFLGLGSVSAGRYADYILGGTYFYSGPKGEHRTTFAPTVDKAVPGLVREVAQTFGIEESEVTGENLIGVKNGDPAQVWTLKEFWLARKWAGILYGLTITLFMASIISAIKLVIDSPKPAAVAAETTA